MTENSDKINQLLASLENLLKKQELFSREISDLRNEINKLKYIEDKVVVPEIKQPVESVKVSESELKKEGIETINQIQQGQPRIIPPKSTTQSTSEPSDIKRNLEKFIGENLINKIGIVITVIGVAIGAKYSIEHQLISPLMRIILGYLMGFALLGFGIKLKHKYENYSAVLVSGAMAIMYFITYFAYSFYSLMPQAFAFILMVIITGFTVFAALNYNRQVIAHIGLVGAYTIPFLLSEDSGNVLILFSYTAIINIGILVIAVKKYWKPLYYSSMLLTWLIYFTWYSSKYQTLEHFGLALVFLTIFFVIFYLIFLAYKILQNEKFDIHDVILLLVNSFIFYGIGYSILDNHETGKQMLGLFTICNAIVHSIVSVIIYKRKQADLNLFYFIFGLALVFITIAIPVQLKGNWVTLLWVGEAALLFWIGRTKSISAYEILSYPVMFLAFISLIHDWVSVYNGYLPGQIDARVNPIFNTIFLTSLLVVISFGFINILNQSKKYTSSLIVSKDLMTIISFVIAAIFLYTLYNSFRIEIATYWNQLFADSLVTVAVEGQDTTSQYSNYDLLKFKSIWIINYSLMFLSILSLVNIQKLRNQQLGFFNLGFNGLVIVVFLFQGLYSLSELRESYLDQSLSQYYQRGAFNIGIRYVSFAFLGLLLFVSFKYVYQEFLKTDFKMIFDIVLYITIIWVASSEMISWMDISGSTQSYKLGLSILWGVYSFLLIALGIWKRKKFLRIGAIVLFAITLIKLFFYDISHLDTISKTIVFIVLGVLLLVISFLYNKYKHIISNDIE
ncbi:MAG: DUF2339 domain-containing protein [Tenuifilaceae bacterium]